MNSAEWATGTDAERVAARAPFVRGVTGVTAALFFLQLTVLTPTAMEAALGFASASLGQRWWTVVTFPLVHTAVAPLLVNLAVIGIIGGHLERRWGTGEYARYFAVCALGTWSASVVLAPPTAVLTGSAGPAIGTLLAFAATSGRGGFFRVGALSLSAGWLATAGTVLILAAGVAMGPGDASAAYLVHVAGLLAGWAYLRMASSISLTRISEGMSPLPDEPEDAPPRAVPKRDPRAARPAEDDIVAKSNAAVAREAATRPAIAHTRRDPTALDRLLDKVSAHGLESLTADERQLLDDLSRRLRDL